MRIHRGLDALPSGLPFVAAVGAFDGLHRGHAHLLAATVAAARAAGDATVAPLVVTFDPHPDAVLRGAAPPLLCDPGEQLARLAALGVEHTVIQRFDREVASWPAEEFVDRLARARRLLAFVMTPGSAFGRDRGGTPDALRELGARRGFAVVEVQPLHVRGALVSSSAIRDLLQAARLADAARLLGRRYAVVGTVVHGDGRGRALGYPTANLAFARPVTLPPDGVYAVRVGWAGEDALHPRRRANAVASLGVRPTFGGTVRVLEAHLFDFDEDLYGERLRVEFVRRQRGERRYRDARALVAQMDRDASRAREILLATT